MGRGVKVKACTSPEHGLGPGKALRVPWEGVLAPAPWSASSGLFGAGAQVVPATFPGQGSVWELQEETEGCAGHHTEKTAILQWTKQVLVRQRRNPEAFLEEMASEHGI